MSVPITIAVDASCLCARPLTGVGYYTLNLFRALALEAPEFRLRFFASSARRPRLAAEVLGQLGAGMRCVRWPSRLKHALWTRFEWPPIEWFTGPADVAHGALYLLPAARRARRITTIVDVSGLRYPHMRRARTDALHLRLMRHAVKRGDAIIAISDSCRKDMMELLEASPDRIHVVYGGVFLEEFAAPIHRERLEALKQRFGISGEYLIHLGTLEPRKNLPRLLAAYHIVRQRHRDLPRLVLAGVAGWMYDDIFATIARLGLENTVIHTGYLTRNDAVLLLRGAFGCVYPSLYEGFGLPVAEAMAARTPVLTSAVSSLPEVIGEHGILVEPENVESIASGLERLIEDRSGAAARVAAAYERVRQFTWQHSARALAAVYRRVLEDHRT